ncbi:hypothetical protein BGZ46_010320 [Entomortierella lignicola]|nr:hypothetical protein BGZ46_010320 [Entomortierella lignicola]
MAKAGDIGSQNPLIPVFSSNASTVSSPLRKTTSLTKIGAGSESVFEPVDGSLAAPSPSTTLSYVTSTGLGSPTTRHGLRASSTQSPGPKSVVSQLLGDSINLKGKADNEKLD